MEGWDLRALAVLERLNAAGHRAVLVGGCVRDRLMGRTPHDYDAATSARPEQIREACAPMRVVETGVRHGTVTVLSGGLPVEVTTLSMPSAPANSMRFFSSARWVAASSGSVLR